MKYFSTNEESRVRKHSFIYKQLVYKEIVLGMSFVKQLLGLNHPSQGTI